MSKLLVIFTIFLSCCVGMGSSKCSECGTLSWQAALCSLSDSNAYYESYSPLWNRLRVSVHANRQYAGLGCEIYDDIRSCIPADLPDTISSFIHHGCPNILEDVTNPSYNDGKYAHVAISNGTYDGKLSEILLHALHLHESNIMNLQSQNVSLYPISKEGSYRTYGNKMVDPKNESNLLEIEYYSQEDQDRFLMEHAQFFRNIWNGTFVELGAHNGISLSNTYSFEKFRKWRGLCIEANPELFEHLTWNRPLCVNENALIGDTNNTEFFVYSDWLKGPHTASAMGGMERYHKSLENFKSVNEAAGKTLKRKSLRVTPLSFVLSKYGFSHIDLLSLDVEGAELAVLNSIDWKTTTISVIIVEINHDEEAIRSLLVSSLGYVEVIDILGDRVFVRKGFLSADFQISDETLKLFWWGSFVKTYGSTNTRSRR